MRKLPLVLGLTLPLAGFVQNPDVLPAARFNRPGSYVLKNVSVIDGTGAPVKRNQTVVVSSGIIQSVGASEATAIGDATVLDLAGSTVLPGFISTHEHVRGGDLAPQLFLARGVTTVRSAASFLPVADINLRNWVRQGRIPGPEFFLTSPALSEHAENLVQYKFVVLRSLRGPDDAREQVRFWASEGFDAVKVYRGITTALLRVVVEEAHRLKLPVIGHLGGVSCADAAAAGIDGIEHGVSGCLARMRDGGGNPVHDPAAPEAQRLFATLVEHNVVVTETPVDLRPFTELELAVLHPGARADYDAMVRENRLGPGVRPQSDDAQGKPGAALAFVKAGGRIALGADAGGVPRVPGFANLRALKLLFTAYGFSTLEAIRIATLDGARALGIDHRTGSIAAGKEADLVVVRGDPSERIKDVEHVQLVFSNGVLYDAQKLLDGMTGAYPADR